MVVKRWVKASRSSRRWEKVDASAPETEGRPSESALSEFYWGMLESAWKGVDATAIFPRPLHGWLWIDAGEKSSRAAHSSGELKCAVAVGDI